MHTRAVVLVVALAVAVASSSSPVAAQCAGACQDITVYCPNSYEQGLCPGSWDIQCCPEPTNCNGQCQDNSLPCSGSYQADLCPGPANVECCQSSGPAPGSGCAGFADSQWNCADPSCSSTVNAGDPQPNYGCAEFVSRSLAAAGYIPGLDPLASQGAYGSYGYNGNTYDLCWTSSRSGGGILGVEDFLIAAGWSNGGGINECTVLLVEGGDGYESHIVIGVAGDTLDAHNNARYHVDGGFYQIDNTYNPPGGWKRNATKPWRPPHPSPPRPSPVRRNTTKPSN